MASGSFTLTRTGSTSQYITFTCNWSSTSNGSSANTSTVKVTVTAEKSSSSTASTYGSQTTTVKVDGNAQSASGSFTVAPGKTITLLSKSWTVAHNNNGTKSVTIDVDVGGNVMSGYGAKTVTLDTIPRYPTFTVALASKEETTITLDWSSDSTIDYLWYSINKGSTWNGVNITDAKSGSYTVTGLSPLTSYYVYIRLRRKDSGLYKQWNSDSIQTYGYPYATSMPGFTIGDKLTLKFYNPLKRSITVNILGADNSQISHDVTTGTSITGYAGEVVVNRLYASIPNAIQGQYSVKVTYGSSTRTNLGGYYSIAKNKCYPVINSVSYKDTNTQTTTITENDQLIIQNKSLVNFTAAGVTGTNSATISRVTVNINGMNSNLTLTGDTATGYDAVINSSSDFTATITATDSRGLTISKNITVKMLEWHSPTAIVTARRENNYYSDTALTVDAEYSSLNGKNTITITYRYYKGTIDITEHSITDGATEIITLDNNYEWTIEVFLTDKLGGNSIKITVPRGIPIIYFDRLLSSVGINCFPKNEKSLEVNGTQIVEKNIITGTSNGVMNMAVETPTKIQLLNSKVVGGKLSLSSDHGILIGEHSNYALISGQMNIQYLKSVAGTRKVYIYKLPQGDTYLTTIATTRMYFPSDATDESVDLSISPRIVEVAEGDQLFLYYYVLHQYEWIGTGTYLTVEIVG